MIQEYWCKIKKFQNNSFYNYGAFIPEFKKSESINSFRDEFSINKNIETNKQSSKGIANLIQSLKNIYNMENEDAPVQPWSFKTDSLFKNNQNSNQFISKPEPLKGNSALDFKQFPSGFSNKSINLLDDKSKDFEKSPGNEVNSYYNFLKNAYVKVNLADIEKEEEKSEEKNKN